MGGSALGGALRDLGLCPASGFVSHLWDPSRLRRATPASRAGCAKSLDGIAAFCDHAVRFWVVESLNSTIKGVIRRGRGMKDEAMLLLKLKWATARPIRSSKDLAKCLYLDLHSNR